MMDRVTIEAAEAAVHAGYPEDAGAILLVEVDGDGRAFMRSLPPVTVSTPLLEELPNEIERWLGL